MLALVLTGLYVVKHPEAVLEYPLLSTKHSPIPSAIKTQSTTNRIVASTAAETVSPSNQPESQMSDYDFNPNESFSPKYVTDQSDEVIKPTIPSKKKEESIISKFLNEIKENLFKSDEKKKEDLVGTSFRAPANVEKLPEVVSQSSQVSNSSCIKPRSPTNLSVSLKSGQVFLSWDKDESSTFSLYRGVDSSLFEVLSTKIKGNEFSDSSTTQGKTYYYKISSTNSCGDSKEFSTTVTVYIPQNFTKDLTFTDSSDYVLDDGLKITNNKIMLNPSNLVSEKTNDGSGTLSDQVFDNYVLLDSNLTISNDSIKMNSGLSGTYISQVFDGKNDTTPWAKLNFITSHPFGKELSISPESGYGSAVTDFSNSLNYLIHFNGTIGNTTSNGSNLYMPIPGQSAQAVNPDNLGMGFVSGPFNSAIRLDGVNDCVVTNYTQSNKTAYTISTWIKTTDAGDRRVIVQNRGSGSGKSLTLGMGRTGGLRGSAGKLSWLVDSDNIDIGVSSVQSYNDGKWHHVVGTWAAPSGTAVATNQFKLYVDGQLVPTISSTTGSATSPVTGLGTTIIGCHQPWASALQADLDEISSWSKELSLSEIQELYIRGANRVKVQVRTCSDKNGNDCAGNVSTWVGAEGTNTSFFSELFNNSSPSTKQGTVLNSYFQSPFSLMGSGLLSWLSVGKNGSDRFIQYKTTFESDTQLSFPNLIKVSFEPLQRYSLLAKFISLKTIDFYDLSKISINQTCGDGNLNGLDDDVRYDLSFDNGSTFYSYKNSAWSVSNSFVSANTKDEIESLSNSQFNTIPTGSNKLTIRSYLSSSGTNGCEVEGIKIEGSK